jgi:hypothetical protein
MQADAEAAKIIATGCNSAHTSHNGSLASCSNNGPFRGASGSQHCMHHELGPPTSTARAGSIVRDVGNKESCAESSEQLSSNSAEGPTAIGASPSPQPIVQSTGGEAVRQAHGAGIEGTHAQDAGSADKVNEQIGFTKKAAEPQGRLEARATPSVAASFCADVKAKIKRLQQELQRRDDSIAHLHVQLQQTDEQHMCAVDLDKI